MTVVLWLLGVVFSAMVGVVLTVVFSDDVAIGLARITSLGGLRGRDVAGTWLTYYVIIPDVATSKTAAQPSGQIEIITLRRIRSRIVGRNARLSREYLIRGEVTAEKFLTGTWADRSNDRHHWGGFQLNWSDSGRYMIGKFVGKDSRNHINHGLWLWARTHADLSAAAKSLADSGGYGRAATRLLEELRQVQPA